MTENLEIEIFLNFMDSHWIRILLILFLLVLVLAKMINSMEIKRSFFIARELKSKNITEYILIFQSGQTFPVTIDKIPDELIFALRVYHVSVYDYEDTNNAFSGKAVSSHNELKVCQTIIDTCQAALKSYKTTNKVF